MDSEVFVLVINNGQPVDYAEYVGGVFTNKNLALARGIALSSPDKEVNSFKLERWELGSNVRDYIIIVEKLKDSHWYEITPLGYVLIGYTLVKEAA